MKKTLVLMMLALFVISAVSLASAKTAVAGKIYNADYSDIVEGATVDVTCTHGLSVQSTVFNTTLSVSDGTYSVTFAENSCDYGDALSVHAIKTGVGENTVNGTVSISKEMLGLDVNIGVVNVPLVPEFGMIAGLATLIGAVGIFFFVRKK